MKKRRFRAAALITCVCVVCSCASMVEYPESVNIAGINELSAPADTTVVSFAAVPQPSLPVQNPVSQDDSAITPFATIEADHDTNSEMRKSIVQSKFLESPSTVASDEALGEIAIFDIAIPLLPTADIPKVDVVTQLPIHIEPDSVLPSYVSQLPDPPEPVVSNLVETQISVSATVNNVAVFGADGPASDSSTVNTATRAAMSSAIVESRKENVELVQPDAARTDENGRNEESTVAAVENVFGSDSSNSPTVGSNIQSSTESSLVPRETVLPRTAILLSRAGVTIPVLLSGFGWIYLPGGDDDGYEYVERQITETGSQFSFFVRDPGNYELKFQRQDNRNGTFETAIVDLLGENAVSSTAVASSGTNRTGSDAPSDITPAIENRSVDFRIARARALADAGLYRDALSEYRELYDEGFESILAEAGRVAFHAGEVTVATEYFSRAFLDADDTAAYEIFLEAMNAVDAGGSIGPVRAIMHDVIESSAMNHQEDYRRFAQALEKAGDSTGAITVYEALLVRFPTSTGSDATLFSLAKNYESDGPLRDERKAHRLYKKILDQYPLSRHYDAAEERVAYIERHYLNIR